MVDGRMTVGNVADVEHRQRDAGQFGQAHAEPVLPARFILIDEPELRERLEQAGHRAAVESYSTSDLVDTQERLRRRERPEDADSMVECLNGSYRSWTGHRSCAPRPCCLPGNIVAERARSDGNDGTEQCQLPKVSSREKTFGPPCSRRRPGCTDSRGFGRAPHRLGALTRGECGRIAATTGD